MDIFETTRRLLVEWDSFADDEDRREKGLPTRDEMENPRHPGYSPGAHNPMSTSHPSMKITRDQHKEQIKGESEESKSLADHAHKLSDHADSLKHVTSNHAELIKHHTAASDAHRKAAGHFRELAKQHGGTRSAEDHSARWVGRFAGDGSGYGGHHLVHNSPEAKHYSQLSRYHTAAAGHHYEKSRGAEHAAKYHSALKTAKTASSPAVKKGAMTRAATHKQHFNSTTGNGRNLAKHMASSDRWL